MNNIDKIKKCLIAGYDVDIITHEELDILWNYIIDLKNQVEQLNELNHENEMYKIRCKRALKLVNDLISDDDCFYIYDILESKKQELKHVLEGEYDE